MAADALEGEVEAILELGVEPPCLVESPPTVEAYIAGFPPEVGEGLRRVRAAILVEVPDAEERMRYGIAAVMLGGRYALHFAGWKKHIGLYPVPTLPEPLESEIAPHRRAKDSLVFLHKEPLPVELVSGIARATVALRATQTSG